MNVGGIASGFLRLGRHSANMLGKMRALIDAHSTALENFKNDGDEPYPNAEGGWTFQGGGGGLPTPLVKNHIISAAEASESGGLIWEDRGLEIAADESSDKTGFAFSVPNPSAVDAHSQMKATGGSANDVLVRTANGAEWKSLSISITVSGTTLTVELKAGELVIATGSINGTDCG